MTFKTGTRVRFIDEPEITGTVRDPRYFLAKKYAKKRGLRGWRDGWEAGMVMLERAGSRVYVVWDKKSCTPIDGYLPEMLEEIP